MSGVVSIVLGAAIIVISATLWRSDRFYANIWEAHRRGPGRRFGPSNERRGRTGVRGALAVAALAGVVLIFAGIWALSRGS